MGLELDDRYSRQVLFREIGPEGQKRLGSAHAAVVGCGATGSAVASLLARAGAGTLRIIDRDYVEPSNLQRQSLFDEADATESLPKAIAAARKIAAFNSQIVVEPQVADLTPENVGQLLSGVQLVLDGTDNFETRYLINDYCVKNSLPWIYAAAVGSYGVTLNIIPGQTACLACVFPDPPHGTFETCETAGILNSAVNLVASIAASRSEEHTSEPSHVAISYAVFCLKKKKDRAARLDRSRAADRAGQLDVARLARRRRRRERQAAAGLECDRRDHA